MRKLHTDEIQRLSAEDFKQQAKRPIILLADNIRSALNIGSMFRTADAFALERFVLCGISATPPFREINKTALGSTETVEWEYFEHTLDAINKYKAQGYKVIAVEQAEGSVFLQDFTISASDKYVLVLGNEVEGVADNVLPLTDVCIEIPQFGTKHSLNVAVAAGIVAFHFAV